MTVKICCQDLFEVVLGKLLEVQIDPVPDEKTGVVDVVDGPEVARVYLKRKSKRQKLFELAACPFCGTTELINLGSE